MIMQMKPRSIQAALGLAIAFSAVSLTAHAAPSVQTATREEQRTIDDIARGSEALATGKRHVALVAIERAETTLLNAQQAETYAAPQAIDALYRAHADVVKGQLGAASSMLHTAQGDLKTP
jgi:hypothetical protein